MPVASTPAVPSIHLAQRYGISKRAVLRLLREQDVPIRRQSMTAADIEQAIRLYQAGNSLATAGAKRLRPRHHSRGAQTG